LSEYPAQKKEETMIKFEIPPSFGKKIDELIKVLAALTKEMNEIKKKML